MSGAKHLSLAQETQEGSSFVAQFLSSRASESRVEASGIRRTLMHFFEQRAKKLNSQNLQLLAEKMVADPFAKVKSMIEGMIQRLLQEANEDAEHEGFCDKV